MHRALGLVLLCAPAAWGLVDGQKVTSSSPADPSEREAFSAVVRLSLGRDGSDSCTATVISRFPPLLATARQCVEDPSGKPRTLQALTFLDFDLNPLPTQIPAKVLRIHVNAAEKEPRGRGDYALIELEEGALPGRAGVASLPAHCPVLAGTGKVSLAGYGANAFDVGPDGRGYSFPKPQTVVGKGTLRWGSNETAMVKKGVVVFQSELAAPGVPDSGTGTGVGTGPGDSGGPVFVRVPGQTKLALAAVVGAQDRVTRTKRPNGVENAAADACDPITHRFFTSVMVRGNAPQISTSLVPQSSGEENEAH